MLREILRPIIFFPLLLILVMLVIILRLTGHESAGPGVATSPFSGSLNVSSTGSQTTTNVDGGALQQAAPPASSVTNTDVTPQQAVPYTAQ